ncbi:hypothetical protein [Tritonibacter scottomollicae]|uniref:hypothetical protein n=1 Tax=Tritonibacter scottomollicae TaxID=483013 RepID=UPI003BACA9F6
MDTNTITDTLELAESGLRATNSVFNIAGRIKSLFQSPQTGSDEEMKALLSDLTLQVADAKLANAELKDKLTQLLEAHSAEQRTLAELDGYRITQTEARGVAYAPKDLPEDHPEFHFICPNCYEDRKKAILQTQGPKMVCGRCATTVQRWFPGTTVV